MNKKITPYRKRELKNEMRKSPKTMERKNEQSAMRNKIR